MRKKCTALLVILLTVALCCHVMAAELVDPNRSGSITFLMNFDGTALDGGSLTMYRVGEITEHDGNYGFACVPEIEGISLDDLNNHTLADKLVDAAGKAGLEAISSPIGNGKGVFSDLKPGLYVVFQRPGEEVPGYAPIDPFLMSLPQWLNDDYVYDLTASPKVPLVPEPTEPTVPTDPTDPTEPWLPQTGQLNWPIPLMAVSGLALFMAGCVLYFGRKKERYEK